MILPFAWRFIQCGHNREKLMKAKMTRDGPIGNSDDIQTDNSSLQNIFNFASKDASDLLQLAINAAAAPPGTSNSSVRDFVEYTDQSSFVTISAAAIPAGASGAPAVPDLIATGPVLASPVVAGPVFASSVTTYAPLVITPEFGTSITNLTGAGADPTTALEVEGAIDAAVDYYENNWTSGVPVGTVINGATINTVNIAIQFDYGTLDGQAMNAQSGASESHYGLTTVGNGSFTTLHQTLSGLLPDLPATNPAAANAIFLVTDAQAQILGTGIAGAGPAGGVGLNTIPNGITLDYNLAQQSIAGEVGAVGAIEHEISEVIGRTSDLGNIAPNTYTVFDLYRFTAPNTPALTPGPADYFSLNNGTTALGYFNNADLGGDAGAWDSSGAHNVPADAFDAFLTTGTAGTISSLDTMALGAIGLRENIVTARTLVWTGAQDTSFARPANWIDSTGPAASAPAASDTARFLSGGGTITGTGTVASLQFSAAASWNLAAGASLSAFSAVTVGQNGDGTLLINGGASINGLGSSDTIGGTAGDAASVVVTGPGSEWNSAGELTVGDFGGGSLTISGQGGAIAMSTPLVPALLLGAGAGGAGTITVTGAGSRASLVGLIVAGQSGTGSLTVENLGTVISGGSTLAPAQGVEVAQLSGGTGSITVSGGQSLLTNTGGFVVGDAGVGSMAIDGGGTVVPSPGAGA